MSLNYPQVYLYRRIVQAKIFIDQHATEQIDLNNISGEASFSKFHFIRLFKKIYGKSPHQYLISVRIDLAKSLLKEGRKISDICSEVGFESLSSFSSLFKKVVGTSPSQFQKKQLMIQNEVKKEPLMVVPHCFAAAKGWTRFAKSNFEEMIN